MPHDEDPAPPERLTIDLSGVYDADQLHTVLRRELRFPGWTSRTWSGFNDVIRTMVELPREITFTGWATLSERLPRDSRILRELFDDYQAAHRGEPAWECTVHYRD
ncbi:barstar family protein [Micromonospora sp. AMSO31t]|uniref:barstar family protein n=1 Tax=Micromonospora sp. AMSO31t TaxID=2650566 RepID=UPI00124BA5F0|nr:barstar family protein [Micromonospora sp. AMSO31t]KAB1915215.1 ribonuclease inhibitor [Micromonospora sp. AMSO31t]